MNNKLIPEVQSPCVSNCCLDGDDVCLGCYRTLTDILVWSRSTNFQRNEIVMAAKERSLQRRKKLE